MNRKVGLILLLAALCCLGLGCIGAGSAGTALALLAAQPFSLIGGGLRALSLSGGAGNLFSILLYVLLSALPLAAAALKLFRGRAQGEDLLLCLLSIQLFISYYLFINPALLPCPALPGMGGMLLGGGIYAVLLAWLILHLVRRFRGAQEPRLLRALTALLYLMIGALLFSAFCLGFSHLLEKMHALGAQNTGADDLGLTYLFLVLAYIVDILPAVLEILLLLSAVSLLRKMSADHYAPETLAAARRVSDFCGYSLIITALAHALLALLQLIFSAHLHQMDMTLRIPFSDMALLLLALLLTRLLAEGKRLRDDNELFV